ncbi:MAG: zinc ribbon domain-containing protein [Proteobacteria bacterium]|nr:zinc ribbon domain-containing protein [Pseudomonadota bacterium]
MPIYEYQCEACGKTFEEIVRISDNNPPACPKCGNKDTRRLLSTCSSKTGGSDFLSLDSSSCGSGGGGGGFS